jgi:hypothetical protein
MHLPWIIDQIADGLTRRGLGPNSYDLDAVDALSSITRVVAFAAAEVLEPLGRQPGERICGAAGLLLESPERPDLEARHFRAGDV